jgi:hypothetical protein
MYPVPPTLRGFPLALVRGETERPGYKDVVEYVSCMLENLGRREPEMTQILDFPYYVFKKFGFKIPGKTEETKLQTVLERSLEKISRINPAISLRIRKLAMILSKTSRDLRPLNRLDESYPKNFHPLISIANDNP